jgi:Protein of unknown function (DUF2563)
MFVDPAGLRAGADTSYKAAEHANDGAAHLSRATAGSGIFGDFAAAQSFHEAVSAAHTRQTDLLKKHSDVLDQLGKTAHAAASTFTEMDDHNGEKLHNIAERL